MAEKSLARQSARYDRGTDMISNQQVRVEHLTFKPVIWQAHRNLTVQISLLASLAVESRLLILERTLLPVGWASNCC
jgi:hypothetical protein